MATQSKLSFEESWQSISALLALRGADGGKRTHAQKAAQNQAALIFCITAWEAYVEDLAREAARYLAANCEKFGNLPKPVRNALSHAVTPLNGPNSRTPSGKFIHQITDDGWRDLLTTFVDDATNEGNFNTPSSKNVAELFKKWCGLDVTDSWYWKNFAAPSAAKRLDESIEIRGQIVHTGQKPKGLSVNWFYTYGESNICKLVERTDGALIAHINQVCGTENKEESFGNNL